MKKRHAHKTNVLLVNITRLGDMLQATPTIAGIKQENPEAKITVLVEKQFEDVCHLIPHIDEIVSIDLAMTVRCLAREQDGIIDAYEYITDFVEKLRAKNFDYCLNMSSSAYTALLLKLLGVTRSGGWGADDEGYRIIESEWAKLFATSVFHQNRQFNSLNLVDVFRASADVEKHPDKLLINVSAADSQYAEDLIKTAGFTNNGPLICLQAGASQQKRQWAPQQFIKLTHILTRELGARLLLVGSPKEREIIDPIIKGAADPNVVSVAGKTTIPQLSAVLQKAELLLTGDTGPMHMAVAVGTPVVSMFLASAYGYETGPYSEGNIVIQPVIACGPCNPNKPCARPDCHGQIEPELVAALATLRLKGDVRTLPAGLVDPQKAIVYRSFFDQYGFLDLEALSPASADQWSKYRAVYRKLWLDDLGGFGDTGTPSTPPIRKALATIEEPIEGLTDITHYAQEGKSLIAELEKLIVDNTSSAKMLNEVTRKLSEVDRKIEERGFQIAPLGPLTRMFVFAKENINGTEALDLASQMGRVYGDLERRSYKFAQYYGTTR